MGNDTGIEKRSLTWRNILRPKREMKGVRQTPVVRSFITITSQGGEDAVRNRSSEVISRVFQEAKPLSQTYLSSHALKEGVFSALITIAS